MHFQIIEISDEPIAKSEWVSDIELCEDATIMENTDYVGDLYNDYKRNGFLKDSLPILLKGIADVDAKDKTITFKSEKECRETMMKEKQKVIDFILERMKNGDCSFYDLRNFGKCFRNWPQLFYYHGGLTSAQFIDDAPYYAGKTFYVGAVYNAHI